MCFQCLSGFKMQNSLPCVSRPSMNDLMSADDQCRGCDLGVNCFLSEDEVG